MLPCRSRAVTIAPAALAWLAHTRIARCLHSFDRLCNLINERGEILSVVAPEIGNGPFNMVVADPVPSFIRDGDAMAPITITGGWLVCAGVTIDFRNAKLWSPKPD